MDTVDIKDVEIFHVGNFRGKDWTEKDIDTFIDTFSKGIVTPTLTIDHNQNLTDKIANDFFNTLSLGVVSSLKKVGNSLKADFVRVPKLIGDFIKSGALKQRSIEFFRKYKTNAGETVNNLLTGVTFFGNNLTGLPAVDKLSDLMSFFKNESIVNYNHKI